MILALDLGSRYVGWAVGNGPADARYGTQELPKLDGANLGRSYALFTAWLADLITVHQPRWLYFEAPAPASTFKQEFVVRALLFYVGQTEHVAYIREVDCSEVNANSVRSYFLRTTPRTTPDGAPIKADDRISLECIKRGHTPADTHQADALALFHFALADRTRRAA
jgi:hypothetical protein